MNDYQKNPFVQIAFAQTFTRQKTQTGTRCVCYRQTMLRLSMHDIGCVCWQVKQLQQRTGFRTLQRKSDFMYPGIETARPQSQCLHSCICDLYIPTRSVHLFSSSRIGKSIVGIYISLTETWTKELGLRPRSSFLGIFVSNLVVLSLQCIYLRMYCSVRYRSSIEKSEHSTCVCCHSSIGILVRKSERKI